MKTLAVIIVNWNVRDLLADCLRSVQADTADGWLSPQIWVVDNASTDGSVEMLQRDFPAVNLIASETNLGFAAGNNAALRAIGFEQSNPTNLPDAVLLLNPDTIVHPGALVTLMEFMSRNAQAGVAGAQLVYGDGSFQHGAFGFPGLWQLAIELLPLPGRLVEGRLNGRYPRKWYAEGKPFEIGHPLGAAMLVRKEAIEQIGLLDEQYHMYVEEIDCAKRIVSAGWKAYCVPAAVITHLGGQSTGQIKMNSFINLWTSRYRFYKTHYGSLKFGVARQIVQVGMRRKAKQGEAAAASGQISQTELSEQVAGYRQVINIWQGKSA